jgi:copper(I)-binding protein
METAMKKTALMLAVFVLAACDGKSTSTTTVSHSSDINGVVTKSSLQMSDYALRAALGNNTTTAAYVTITNNGNQTDRLISASCDCASSAGLHTMEMKGDVMEMGEAKDGFAIAPGQSIVFAPGGNHIMLQGVWAHPKEGDTVKMTLNFEKAGAITLNLPVSNAPLAKASESH